MKRNIVIILLLSMIGSMFPAQVMATAETGGEIAASMASSDEAEAKEMSEALSNSTLHEQEAAMTEASPFDEDTATLAEVADGQDTEAVTDESEDNAFLFADTLTYGNLQYTVNGDNITIIGCNEGVTSLTIPAQIDGKNVSAIADYAFNNHSDLTTLTIPEGVTNLGYYMINGTGITSITIPSTVESSGSRWTNGALAGCAALTEVIFAEGTRTIPAYICASDDQTSYIKTVVIPASVEEIGYAAFYKCYK